MLIDPPSSALLLETISPAFNAGTIDRMGQDRMPPDILAACAAQAQDRFPARPIRLWLLKDVLVASEGLVFDRDGQLYAASVTQHHPHEIEAARTEVLAAIADPMTLHVTLPVVLGKKRGANNYGHWLLEMLPVLDLARRKIDGDRLGVLVHDVTNPQLGGVMFQSLRRIGVADQLVRVAGYAAVRISALLLLEGLTSHGTYMSPLVVSTIERLGHGIPFQGPERVFIRRGHDMRRNFAQPTHLEELATDLGYHIVDTIGLNLEDQMAAVRGARVVAGALGAAMTNAVFAGPGARIKMFAGAAMPDTFFWFASIVSGQTYQELRCEQIGEPDGAFYDRKLVIDDDEARTFLAD